MIIALSFALVAFSQASPSIYQFIPTGLKDASFTARVLQASQTELRKINKDFGQSYRFETTTIHLKEPMKVRLDASVEDTHVLYIINGVRQSIEVPKAHINSHQDLTGKPGRRQTALDFGLLTSSLFDSLFTAKFVRMDRATGDAVFDLTYPPAEDTSRNRIWVDPQKKCLAKREWYNQYGRQMATFFYENPREEEGVWIPTKLTVKNVEDRVAGITAYDSIRVNTGISDSLFN